MDFEVLKASMYNTDIVSTLIISIIEVYVAFGVWFKTRPYLKTKADKIWNIVLHITAAMIILSVIVLGTITCYSGMLNDSKALAETFYRFHGVTAALLLLSLIRFATNANRAGKHRLKKKETKQAEEKKKIPKNVYNVTEPMKFKNEVFYFCGSDNKSSDATKQD